MTYPPGVNHDSDGAFDFTCTHSSGIVTCSAPSRAEGTYYPFVYGTPMTDGLPEAQIRLIIDSLIEAINQIKQHSVVLLVEQNFYMASQVGDHFYILDDGKVVHNGSMADLVEDQELQSRYLGITG